MRIIFVNYVWYNGERFEPRKESWCANSEQTPLNRSQQLLALQGCQKDFKGAMSHTAHVRDEALHLTWYCSFSLSPQKM